MPEMLRQKNRPDYKRVRKVKEGEKMDIYEKHTFTVWKNCPICGKRHYIKRQVTDNQYIDYQIRMKPLQAIFPEMTKQDREFLKTGICKQCQKDIF